MEQAFRQASFSMSVFDAAQRYVRLNRTACQVMGVDEESLRGQVFPYGVPGDVDQQGTLEALRDVAATGKPAHYESFTRAPSGIREHAWNLELWPIRDAAGAVCAVGMVGFDSSEQHWARQRLAILDEAAVTIGRSLDLDQTARELAELVVPRFADFASVDLLEAVMHGAEPPYAGPDGSIELRRLAHMPTDHGADEAVIALAATDTYPPYSPPARALSSGLPVLSGSGDEDFDRWIATVPARAERLSRHVGISLMAVPLIARGAPLGVAVLVRTRTDAFNQDDVALAKDLASRAALCVDNAMMESFWARVQVELLNRRRWRTRLELSIALFEYLERPRCPIAYAARSRAARCDVRVGARGCPVHQASSRSRLTAVAVRTCARAVFRSPV